MLSIRTASRACLIVLLWLLGACTAESTAKDGSGGSRIRGLFEGATDSAGGAVEEVEALIEAELPYGDAVPTRPVEPARLVLSAPTMNEWRPRLGPIEPTRPEPREGSSAGWVIATDYNAPVFKSPQRRGVIGRVRRGNQLRARPASGGGCRGGRWYRLLDEAGFVCTKAGFERLAAPSVGLPIEQRQPDVTLALPLDHAEVKIDGAPRLLRLPTTEEAELLDEVVEGELDHERLGDLVVQRMVGDYFLAIDEAVASGDRRYFRTVKGHFVRAEDVELLEASPMQGEHLGEEDELPIAFVHQDGTELACPREGAEGDIIEACGEARRYARFEVERVFEEGGSRWVESKDGFLVPRAAVRIARKIEPPSRISAAAKWAHINLEEQTLVAYEGRRPVFATLVTTGTEGYTTPAGLWRTNRKYITRTMRGGNERKGFYDVEEVPWTIYYNRGWAVHGAYWHDEFGNVRSHGCTNLAPADARWVFYWSSLPIPEGWHAVTGRQGTWWYFTRS